MQSLNHTAITGFSKHFAFYPSIYLKIHKK